MCFHIFSDHREGISLFYFTIECIGNDEINYGLLMYMVIYSQEENPRITSPPIQQVVSHDHGYLKATPYVKYEPAEQGETGLSEIISSEGPQMHLGLNSSQVLIDF